MPLEVCSVVGRGGREVGCGTGCERERRDRGMREEASGAPAVCLSSPSGDLAGRGWACRLLPAASDVIPFEVKPLGVWCNWQHD